MENTILVTGSSGLIGSEVSSFFCERNYKVYGIDNNMREVFFGKKGSTKVNLKRLEKKFQNFSNYNIDIRDRKSIDDLVKSLKPKVIVHTAAQPSHDKASEIPFLDFEVNALGTLNLLEAVRKYCKDTPFIHLSTNKVYGDTPNKMELKELATRWEYRDYLFKRGIDEKCSIDQSTHSLFGVSKVSSDLLVQEYGRYFQIPTCCLRGGCLTGPSHSGVQLHGFLNYLIRCNLLSKEYTIFGYKGKQVRDNIHSYDVANFIYLFSKDPKISAVYNIGGGYENSISILEAISKIEEISGLKMNFKYSDQSRIGDHICYYSNLDKIKSDFPKWNISKSLDDIFFDVYQGLMNK
ncbi:NAD-dependent epimerase/dehydratase family protein [uncultured Prochlorococcus sp.]|uniref:NAD-dependent epimerase/dehydratase family protein n=1 Tax=uncultured Prochlorococcus sp. TaxID=159733 RepID=UPI002589EC42|nr:NAD-dependent epimerase/dehydratase family protein [uncultured Prochlorococcus sp.]